MRASLLQCSQIIYNKHKRWVGVPIVFADCIEIVELLDNRWILSAVEMSSTVSWISQSLWYASPIWMKFSAWCTRSPISSEAGLYIGAHCEPVVSGGIEPSDTLREGLKLHINVFHGVWCWHIRSVINSVWPWYTRLMKFDNIATVRIICSKCVCFVYGIVYSTQCQFTSTGPTQSCCVELSFCGCGKYEKLLLNRFLAMNWMFHSSPDRISWWPRMTITIVVSGSEE